MKKQIIIIVFMLIGWMSGNGQNESGLRNNSNLDINDFAGFPSSCQNELETVAGDVKTLMPSGNSDLKIALVKVYPPSAYINKKDGINAMAELSRKNIADQYLNYILFIAEILEDENVKITMDYSINFTLPGECSLNSEILFGALSSDLSKVKSSLNQAECTITNALENLKFRLSTGCNYDANEAASYLKSKGFYLFSLDGFNVEYGNPPAIKADPNHGKRELCHVIDYTEGEMKLNNNAISTYLDSPSLSQGSKRIIISNYKVFLNNSSHNLTLSNMVEEELLSPYENGCDATVVIHFIGKIGDGPDYVAIGVKTNDKAVSYGNYTVDQIKEMAAAGNLPNQSQLISIKYRTHDSMKANANALVQMIPHIIGDDVYLLSPIWYVGYTSGVMDGLIDLLDSVGLICQIMYHELAQMKNAAATGGALFLADIVVHMVKMKGFVAGIQDKFNSDEEFDLEVETFINHLKNITMDQILSFCWNMIKDVAKNVIFMNGAFEAGYAVGKIAFEVISAVLTEGASGVMDVMTAMKKANTFLKSVGEGVASIAKTKGDDIVRLVSANLDDLVKAIVDLQNLKQWYNLGMKAQLKGRLLDWAQDIKLKHYLQKLDNDLGQMPNLKSWLEAKGIDGLDSWRYLEDAFPDRIWCIP